MEQFLLCVGLSFLITFCSTPIIIRIAHAKKLYDNPDNIRKLHKLPVPSLGGIGLFLGVFISLSTFSEIWISNTAFPCYLATFVIIISLGLKDDILSLSPWTKVRGQVIIALLLTFKAELLLNNMHGFLGYAAMSPMFSYPFTIFTIIVIINAFNLIDGVDGLASTIALIAASAFGLYFIIDGQLSYALFSFSLVASLIAFLIFNFPHAKIFMGDGGSMFVGLILAILSIQFITSAPFSKVHAIAASPVLGFGFILFPIMDTLRVFTYRLLKGRSPFSPDRNHIHHLLLDSGFSNRAVVFFSALIGILSILASYYFAFVLGCTYGILALIVFFYLCAIVLYLIRKNYNKKTMKIIKSDEIETKISLSNSAIR